MRTFCVAAILGSLVSVTASGCGATARPDAVTVSHAKLPASVLHTGPVQPSVIANPSVEQPAWAHAVLTHASWLNRDIKAADLAVRSAHATRLDLSLSLLASDVLALQADGLPSGVSAKPYQEALAVARTVALAAAAESTFAGAEVLYRVLRAQAVLVLRAIEKAYRMSLV